jgi:hypothetical protein
MTDKHAPITHRNDIGTTRGIDEGDTVTSYRVLSTIDKIDSELLASFGELPPDGYTRGASAFRYRAFGAAIVKGDTIKWTENRPFFQSEDINAYAGGLERRFPPLPEAARRFAAALAVDPQIRDVVGGEELEIGVHQMRVTASDEHNGYPAPEGFHQDGFEHVAVTCIAQRNVNGGVSMIAPLDDPEQIVLDRRMQPGETVLLDDLRVRHYVTPFTPKLPGTAYRDVVVVTFTVTTA